MHNRLVCIVNNYNYARYLPQCLDSALSQAFDRIVVVDDGSSDDSVAIIEAYAGRDSRLVPIIKPNGGQLSCFNAAAGLVDAGDLVFFLDADDLFPADYASEVAMAAARQPADFYFCTAVEFVDGQTRPAMARISDDSPVVVPCSSALTLVSQRWIGSPTSALVLTGELFHRVIPYPLADDWRVRADDVLVFAASILGARKVGIRSLGVGYRQHGRNLFAGNDQWNSPHERALRKARVERLFRFFCARAGLRRYPGQSALKAELNSMGDAALAFLRIDARKLLRRSLRNRIRHLFLGGWT